jgi:hypothetical protein
MNHESGDRSAAASLAAAHDHGDGQKDFVLLTHSRWDEPPRIRHQVTDLLLSHGKRVVFFERARYGLPKSEATERRERLTLVATNKLIHAQVRVVPLLHEANRRFVVRQLSDCRHAGLFGTNPRIINFNHDYYFLRDVFPNDPIITIINDDFEAQSRLPFRRHITWALERTCRSSDRVLALSEGLRRRLAPWCEDTRVFLPWAVAPYVGRGGALSARDALLFWGSIDQAIDLGVLGRLARDLARSRPGWKVILAGPLAKRFRTPLADLADSIGNIEVLPPAPLSELPIHRVLAAVIPYRRHPVQDAIAIANKTFQLVARGLPLMISGMPDFLPLPFVVRLDAGLTTDQALGIVEREVENWQPHMRAFIEANPPESRLEPLCSPLHPK